jgi:hypothetical protein
MYRKPNTYNYPAAASGLAVINVKICPVSQSGRRVQTGPYIYQVALLSNHINIA